nr:immunoglobulin heavy chain junction region [Mus musculus]MBK4185080.1 immunoglobulin heavy chain junction region [Mus musculus]MBK4185081.1 immunoglobulin heavy chain junction region [Mus musculus]
CVRERAAYFDYW